MSEAARKYHERDAGRADALSLLRSYESLTDARWKQRHPGSRLAPVVDMLRNAHGFTITGEGRMKDPYRMPDRYQFPQLVRVTPEIRLAYYASEHWAETKSPRMRMDNFRCVLCRDSCELEVHHICYRLFAEELKELLTVCRVCHRVLHEKSRLKFPSGILAFRIVELGREPFFDSWLLPPPPPQETLFDLPAPVPRRNN